MPMWTWRRPGSSPLTRGKQGARRPQRRDERLIPAHAGKTAFMFMGVLTNRAHPRSRGENPGQLGTGIVGAGSSPLTRGKLRPGASKTAATGLIPAHAGKTGG